MNRNTFLDFTKGLLITLVVVGHFIQVFLQPNQPSNTVYLAIYLFHMPLFMALSGWFTQASAKHRSVPNLLLVRAVNYLVPLAVFGGITVLVLLLVEPQEISVGNLAKLLKEQLATYWFLKCLYACLVPALLLRLLGRRVFAPLFAILTILAIVSPGNEMPFPRFVFPFFAIGWFASWLRSISSRENAPKSLAKRLAASVFEGRKTRFTTIGYAATAIAALVCFHFFTKETLIYFSGSSFAEGNRANVLLRFAGGLSGSIAFMGAAWWIFGKLSEPVKNIFVGFGRESLGIYLLQAFALFFCLRHEPWNLGTTGHVLVSVASVPAAFALTALFHAIARFLCKHPLPALVLFGKIKFSSTARKISG